MAAIKDIRQTDEWASYLKSIGWKSERTSNGTLVNFRKFPFGHLVKIQRPPQLKKKDLDEIEGLCAEKKALFIKIEPNFGQNVELLEDRGYRTSLFPLIPTKTMFIHLDNSEEDLWKAVSRSGKYKIRRSQREGADVKIYRNPAKEKLEEYHKMHVYTGKRKKFYVQPFKDLVKKTEIFGENAHLILVYNADGSLAGGKFYVCKDDYVLYLFGGTSAAGRKSNAGYALLWESIKYFKSLDYKSLDLEGLDDDRFPSFTKNWGGFSYFKEKFGGEVVEFPYPHIKYLNSVMELLSRVSPVGL